jgi:uncharacterized protein (DUF1684 family)
MHHDPVEYEWHVARERSAKDAFFRSSPHSPIPPLERPTFAGLAYYEIDPGLRFEGLHLTPLSAGEEATIEIATSDGATRVARRLGSLEFVLGRARRRLVAYELGAGDGSLFVPFLDATSGSETYGAGRYLDIEPEADGTYVLDLNLAYQPFCAYSPNFSCPLTPAENRLPDRIEAGERLAPVAVR